MTSWGSETDGSTFKLDADHDLQALVRDIDDAPTKLSSEISPSSSFSTIAQFGEGETPRAEQLAPVWPHSVGLSSRNGRNKLIYDTRADQLKVQDHRQRDRAMSAWTESALMADWNRITDASR